MFRFLREIVLQPSFSRDKEDVDAVGLLITRELAGLPMTMETVEQEKLGDHLVFRSPACSKHERSILLVGHMDTVFPRTSGFDWYKDEGTIVRGPGVIDMKGGLVTAIFALKALHKKGLLDEIPITLICNSDEEIGSPSSYELFCNEAQKGIFGLVFECGGLKGEIVTGRKGKSGYTLQVHGKAGHAAFAGKNKPSAILEMAHKIIAIEALNAPARQLVVNIGTIEGGIGPNTVPEFCSVSIDTRFINKQDGSECMKAIQKISDIPTIQKTTATLSLDSGRKPMEPSAANKRLYQHINAIAEKLGAPIAEELRSGVSDANTLGSVGLPVVDGMGPIGAHDHSDREYMVRDSLAQRTVLTTLVLAQYLDMA